MATAIVREKPKRRFESFFTGMALFSMFFGAGNLIFPLLIGQAAGNQTPSAILGLTISAVAFPFLGLISMMLFGGNLRPFLERLGKWPAFFLLLILQITQGPLCMSRLFTLMHASIKGYFPWATLPVASLLIALIVFLLTYRPQKIVAVLGTILTPLLLLSLGLLMVVGILYGEPQKIVSEGARFHFVQGVKGGYLTMDLISALLFATMVMPHLTRGTEGLSPQEREREVRRKMFASSVIAAVLLTLSYIGLCFLSAHHHILPANIAPEDLLQAIAMKVLGPWGGIVAAVAVFLACFTTAISLAAIFADYVRKDLFKEKISSLGSLLFTLSVTAAIANLGFSGVIKLMGPILEILYPALIVLCLLNIAHQIFMLRVVKLPVFLALILAVGGFCLRG